MIRWDERSGGRFFAAVLRFSAALVLRLKVLRHCLFDAAEFLCGRVFRSEVNVVLIRSR